MLSIFNQNHPYTKFTIKEVLKLKGSHSIQLYQLLKQYESIGVRDFDEENFRNIFELQDKYSLLWNLKKRVIVPAVLEINKSTELQVSFENIKEGKKITGFRFFISRKKTKKLSDPVKEKKSLRIPTERQRQLFASKLSELPEMSKYSQGTESYQQFAVRIAEMLKDPEKINELFPLLRKVGFK